METLIQNIRQCPDIAGIEIENVTHKTAAFADDLLILTTNPEKSVPTILDIFDKIGALLNFKINLDNSEASGINLTQSRIDILQTPFPFR